MAYESVAYRIGRNPTVTDDRTKGFSPGGVWENSSTGAVFTCGDSTAGAAVWVQNAADMLVLSNATSGAQTVNVPSAATVGAGTIYTVAKTDVSANTVSIAPAAGQSIDSLTTTRKLYFQNDFITLQSDGTNWRILRWQVNGEVPLTFAATLTIDCSQIPPNGVATVTATANLTLAAFINYTSGQRFVLNVKQDATGGRTMTFTAGVNGGQRVGTSPPIPTVFTANKKYKYGFLNDGVDNRFDFAGLAGEF